MEDSAKLYRIPKPLFQKKLSGQPVFYGSWMLMVLAVHASGCFWCVICIVNSPPTAGFQDSIVTKLAIFANELPPLVQDPNSSHVLSVAWSRNLDWDHELEPLTLVMRLIHNFCDYC